ncbi:MAG: hypothetical protein DYH08_16200 [Actinobacteria bacterium ATB1]|nr:hypothetical protein [Actinobacteria bacterium ATB1]
MVGFGRAKAAHAGEMVNVQCELVVKALRDEQRELTRLGYDLEVQRLVIDASRWDLMAQAGRDIEHALTSLRRADLARAVTVAAAHAQLTSELEPLGVSAGSFPTLGQIASAAPAGDAGLLLDLGAQLERLLAKVVALAALHSEVGGEVLQSSAETRLERRLELFLESVAVPDTPAELLDALEEAVSEDDPSVADALLQLRLQSVSFEAAVGLLRSVGCTPLLDFLREDHVLAPPEVEL